MKLSLLMRTESTSAMPIASNYRMTSPRDLNIADFTYELPEERIPLYPLSERDSSKLLVFNSSTPPQTEIFRDIASLLPESSLLVLNNTRVVHARLLFQKDSGAHIEIFCLNPLSPVKEMQSAFAQSSPVVWECLVGNAKRWKEGVLRKELSWAGTGVLLFAERQDDRATGRLSDGATPVSFRWEPAELAFAEVMEHFGNMPLPPYLKRDAEDSDETAYQTVYAIHEGSVAAPTAGLHFTENVLQSLKNKGITTSYLTLHVGAGTFRPVASEKIGDHPMHPEPFFVNRELVQSLMESGARKVIPVGTTSVRSLESLYWFGVKLIQNREQPFFLDQWDVYEVLRQDIPLTQSFEALLTYMDTHELDVIEGVTRLIIAPGYRFRVISGMVTNFHQPGSTLLLLVSAFLGDNWRKAYEYALDNDFRFLSFGDSCLFLG